jgi:regulator of sigma E protease
VESGDVTPLFEGLVEGKTNKRIVKVIPRKDPPEGQGALGVVIAEYPYVITQKCPMFNTLCIFKSIQQGVKSTGLWVGRVFEGLRSIGKSLMAGKPPEGVAGPVGIYQLTGLVAAEGFLPLVELVAVLSINLAVFNVLPIPALDGGRAVFIYLEYFLKRRIPAEVEQKVNSWGMAFLLGLMLLISLQDIWRLGWLSKILGK